MGIYEKTDGQVLYEAYVQARGCEPHWEQMFGEYALHNTAEGYFGNSKRSIDGTHHSISRKHTSLYFAELDHKYNTRKMTDGERTVVAIRRMEGKRLMLHSPQRKAG